MNIEKLSSLKLEKNRSSKIEAADNYEPSKANPDKIPNKTDLQKIISGANVMSEEKADGSVPISVYM